MVNSQLLIILVAAMVACVIGFRLYSVLGRRTGDEQERPQEGFGRVARPSEPAETVAPLPGARPETPPKPLDETGRAMMDIKLADRGFDTDHFIAGAKKAHELIVTAYARNDRDTLRPLLNDEVFQAFDHAMKARESRKETVKFTLVGYRDAKIVHASLKGRIAEVTLQFSVQFISSTSNEAGAVIEGDPAAVRDVTDVWTFSRDLRSADPNWTLVATSGGEF